MVKKGKLSEKSDLNPRLKSIWKGREGMVIEDSSSDSEVPGKRDKKALVKILNILKI